MANIDKLKKELSYWKKYARDICPSTPCVENIMRLEKEIKQLEKGGKDGKNESEQR